LILQRQERVSNTVEPLVSASPGLRWFASRLRSASL